MKSGNSLPHAVHVTLLIAFVSKVKKVEKAKGAEVYNMEHIKLEFFMDSGSPGYS